MNIDIFIHKFADYECALFNMIEDNFLCDYHCFGDNKISIFFTKSIYGQAIIDLHNSVVNNHKGIFYESYNEIQKVCLPYRSSLLLVLYIADHNEFNFINSVVI